MSRTFALVLLLTAVPLLAADPVEIAYGPHEHQKLDLYRAQGQNRPVMVYVHGGGWHRGDKSRVGAKAEAAARADWVFVSLNYRLLPDGKHPVNVQDIAAALAFVHERVAEHGGSPGAMFLMGHSAGAHLVSLVATDHRHLARCGKDLSILRGVIEIDTAALDLLADARRGAPRVHRLVFGSDEATLRDASPLHHVAPGKHIPPFLLISAGEGRRSVQQARDFAAALRKAQVSVEVIEVPEHSHESVNAAVGVPGDKITQAIADFVNANLPR